VDFFDNTLPGFLLEVRASGGKTFYQRYRDARGREHRFKVGPASVLTVKEARVKARSVLASAYVGGDPQRQREQLRNIPLLREFALEKYLPFVRDTKRSWRTDETLLRKHVLPSIGRLALDEVGPFQVTSLLQSLSAAGYSTGTTNRVLVLIRYVFNLAARWQILEIRNPTTGLKTAPDRRCQRFLTSEEAKSLRSALDHDQNRTAAEAIRLLLLTGGRRNEILAARWENVDWENATLLVPRSKSGQARYIILSRAAVNLLKDRKKETPSEYIFASDATGRPSTSLHFPWTRIRKRAGLMDLRLHDLRHSFASFLVNGGVSLYVVQKLLGHAHVGTTQRYAHLSDETLLQAVNVAAKGIGEAINV
jgi:integrase